MTEPTTLIGGRFRILEILGSGGQGSVYKAEMVGPRGFSRVVAIKRLHNNSLAPIARFVDEARLAAVVRHPNVVQTLEIAEDEDEDELVIVMEHVEGVSLSQVNRDLHKAGRRMPINIALAILGGALRGLHAAHQATAPDGNPLGIVHRDFSPANIMIDRFGVPKVLDFGVAKAHQRTQEQTRAGRLKGKLGYMAPEQIHGAGDRSIDLWAAGVVLWELLTGRRLFVDDSPPQLLSRILGEPIVPASTFNPDIPQELQRIANKALDRNPSARFTQADAMAEALEACGPATAQQVAAFITFKADEPLPFTETELSDAGPTRSIQSHEPQETTRPQRRLLIAGAICMAAAFGLTVWLSPVPKQSTPTLAPAPSLPPEITETAVLKAPPSSLAKALASSTASVAAAEEPPEATSTPFVPDPAPPKKTKRRKRSRRRTTETKVQKKANTAAPVEPKTVPTAAPKRPECEVPWTYVDGVKKWKRECF